MNNHKCNLLKKVTQIKAKRNSMFLSLCTIEAFAYSSSDLGDDVCFGHYSNLANTIKIISTEHFQFTSSIFYSEQYPATTSLMAPPFQITIRDSAIKNDVGRGVSVGNKSLSMMKL